MREKISRLLLAGMEKHTPPRMKSIELQILLNATAAAFGQPKKKILQLSADEALQAYAAFTTACLSDFSNTETDRKRVVRCAYRLGRRIRQISGLTRQQDLQRLVFYLYGNLGIKMTGRLPGEVIVPACYFSNIYTPDQCRTMSLMDWGVISGICGGGKLVFTERLTQGCGRCRACLTRK